MAVSGNVSNPRTAEEAVEVATTLGEVRRVLEINFVGAFLMLPTAAMTMLGRGGAIVNVTSRTASVGIAGTAAYAASKGALSASRGPLRSRYPRRGSG